MDTHDVAFYLVGGKLGTVRFLQPHEITKRGKLKKKLIREMEFYKDVESFVAGGKETVIMGPVKMTFNDEGEIIDPPEYAT